MKIDQIFVMKHMDRYMDKPSLCAYFMHFIQRMDRKYYSWIRVDLLWYVEKVVALCCLITLNWIVFKQRAMEM
jgi:hypothetical protein